MDSSCPRSIGIHIIIHMIVIIKNEPHSVLDGTHGKESRRIGEAMRWKKTRRVL